MLLARRYQFGCISRRGFSSLPKNHYDSLGIKSTATHAEIKTAYYELSKIHHPDLNKGSAESLNKFRQVTDAYEILGNVKSRKLYDRGLVVGSSGTVLREDVVPDDPTARFYKQRDKRTHVPTSTGRTTVYDFDAWARAHYIHTKERRSFAKDRYNAQLAATFELKRRKKVDKVAFTAFLVLLFYTVAFSTFFGDNPDVVRIDNSKKSKQNNS